MSLPFFGLRLSIRYLQVTATYQLKCGQAKKENGLPVKEMCRANIVRTQMLSGEWRQIGQKLQRVSVAAKDDTPLGYKVKGTRSQSSSTESNLKKANSAVKDPCSEHSVYKLAAQRN